MYTTLMSLVLRLLHIRPGQAVKFRGVGVGHVASALATAVVGCTCWLYIL